MCRRALEGESALAALTSPTCRGLLPLVSATEPPSLSHNRCWACQPSGLCTCCRPRLACPPPAPLLRAASCSDTGQTDCTSLLLCFHTLGVPSSDHPGWQVLIWDSVSK